MYCYTVYEYVGQKWKITEEADLELTDLDEAKAEVEHCIPLYITEREWTTGEGESHWLIQFSPLGNYMVCLDLQFGKEGSDAKDEQSGV